MGICKFLKHSILCEILSFSQIRNNKLRELMKIDDLQNSTNDELQESKKVENLENDALDAVEKTEVEFNETVKEETVEDTGNESSAELLIKKAQELKSLKEQESKESKEEVVIDSDADVSDNTLDENENSETSEHTESTLQESTDKEENVAESNEEKENVEKKEEDKKLLEKVDYSVLSRQELVGELQKLTEYEDAYAVKDKVESIRIHFFKKLHAQLHEQKAKFLENGGEESAFKPEVIPEEEQFKAYYSVYRENRAKQQEKIEAEKQHNLSLKYQIIDKIGEITTAQESLNKTFQDFKELQKQWQAIGMVPQSELKKLWESYNYQVEKFYDYVKINKDLRDLDLKKNLQAKTLLCEQAEKLISEEDVILAFRELQKLHEQWREQGPVASDKREDLWSRFKQATSAINKRHQEYFDNLKQEQVNNLKAKTLLCEKVEEINTLELNNHKEWEENSREVIELQGLWKKIGFAPKKDNNKIYERFRQACDTFFDAKREFYSKNKELEEKNLQIKLDFCEKAESMMDSTDWRKATDFYINLQKQWKTIGQVPRKNKDEVWQRFRKACNAYFDRKSEYFKSRDDDEKKNLELKKQLIEEVKTFEIQEDREANFQKLKDFRTQWNEIGYVPIKQKNSINQEFRNLIDGIYDKLNLDEAEKNKLNFKNRLEALQSSPKSYGRIRNERDKIISKLDKLKSDIVLWENNIGFFAKSKSSESMIKKFEHKINKAKAEVEALKQQLRMINNLDN